MITFHVGRFDSSMTPLAFVVKWRELVETAVPGPAPEPQIRREGDFSFAVGARHARSNGKAVTLSLVTVTGRGRTVGIVGMAAGDEALREFGAFFETVALTPAASAGTTWGPPVSGASGLVGRWWKDAGGSNYFWYEFSDKGFFSVRVTTRRFPGDLPRAGQSDHIHDLHGLDDDPQLFFRVRGWQGPPRDQWRVGLLVCSQVLLIRSRQDDTRCRPGVECVPVHTEPWGTSSTKKRRATLWSAQTFHGGPC